MSWVTFRAWQKLAFQRGVERQNTARAEQAGRRPARRPRMNNERGPQEPPA